MASKEMERRSRTTAARPVGRAGTRRHLFTAASASIPATSVILADNARPYGVVTRAGNPPIRNHAIAAPAATRPGTSTTATAENASMSSLVASTSVPRVARTRGMNDPVQKAAARRWKTSKAESTGESRRTVWPVNANDAATASAPAAPSIGTKLRWASATRRATRPPRRTRAARPKPVPRTLASVVRSAHPRARPPTSPIGRPRRLRSQRHRAAQPQLPAVQRPGGPRPRAARTGRERGRGPPPGARLRRSGRGRRGAPMRSPAGISAARAIPPGSAWCCAVPSVNKTEPPTGCPSTDKRRQLTT